MYELFEPEQEALTDEDDTAIEIDYFHLLFAQQKNNMLCLHNMRSRIQPANAMYNSAVFSPDCSNFNP